MRDKQKLSPQQEEIVRLSQDGRSNREIAEALKVGTRAVETQIRRIRQKLGTLNRTETLTHAVANLAERGANESRQLAALARAMNAYIVAFDEDYEVVYANDRAHELDMVQNDRSHQLKAVWKAIVPAQDRLRLHKPRAQDYDDFRVRMKTVGHAEKTISWSSSASSNPIPGWSAWSVGIDITEFARNETDAKLKEMARTDIDRAAVWTLDDSMRTLSASPALGELLGASPAQLANSAISDFLPQDQYPVLRDLVHSGREDVPIVLQRADQERIAVQVTCRIRKTSDEPLDGMVLIVKRPPNSAASLRYGA